MISFSLLIHPSEREEMLLHVVSCGGSFSSRGACFLGCLFLQKMWDGAFLVALSFLPPGTLSRPPGEGQNHRFLVQAGRVRVECGWFGICPLVDDQLDGLKSQRVYRRFLHAIVVFANSLSACFLRHRHMHV